MTHRTLLAPAGMRGGSSARECPRNGRPVRTCCVSQVRYAVNIVRIREVWPEVNWL